MFNKLGNQKKHLHSDMILVQLALLHLFAFTVQSIGELESSEQLYAGDSQHNAQVLAPTSPYIDHKLL